MHSGLVEAQNKMHRRDTHSKPCSSEATLLAHTYNLIDGTGESAKGTNSFSKIKREINAKLKKIEMKINLQMYRDHEVLQMTISAVGENNFGDSGILSS